MAGRRQRGFTLLEMLIVLTIAGLLVGLASLAITRNPRAALQDQAMRLALAFETASDEAQLRNAPIRWEPVGGGYRFAIRDGGRWRALQDEIVGAAAWQTDITHVAIRYAGVDRDAGGLVFGVESIGMAASVTLYSDRGTVTIATNGNGRYVVTRAAGSGQG